MNDWLLAITYARRELRAGLSGFYVFLLCLILGVGAIAAVQSVSHSLTAALHRDGRQILGGDIELRTLYAPLTKKQAEYFGKISTAMSVTAESRAMVRNADETKTALGEVKAVDSYYPLFGTLEVFGADGKKIVADAQELLGQLKGGNWGILVPRELLDRLEAKIGDSILIGKLRYDIRGRFDRLPDAAESISFLVAPHILISSDSLTGTGLLSPGNAVAFEHHLALPGGGTVRELEIAEKKINADYPGAQWRIRNFYNASPRLERYIERLTFFLTLIGLTTLVVGGVGISNAVRAYLDTKLANIATLKCLGAPGSFVFRVYMLLVLMLALIGIAIGAAIGGFSATAAGSFLTARLSLSDTAAFYPDAVLLSAGFGLLATLCFSLWPVGRAINVTPADLFRDTIAPRAKRPSRKIMAAITASAAGLAVLAVATAPDRVMATYFTAGALATIGVFLIAAVLVQAGLRHIKIPAKPEARMAIANLSRPGNTTSGAVLSLGLGLTVLITITLVEYNFSRLLKDDLAIDAPSFFFLDIQPGQKGPFEKIALSHPSAKNLRITPSLRGRIVKINGREAETSLVSKTHEWVVRSDRGFTYAAALPAHSTITEGQWWEENYKGPPLVSIATDVAKAFGIGAGDEITVEILGDTITAKVANVREIDWASFSMNFAVTFAPGTLEPMPATSLATLIIGKQDETALQTQLAREFPNVTSIRVREALEAAGAILGTIAQAVRISAAVTLVAGMLVLAGGIAASRRRHVYDAIILKVLGAERGRIARTFLLEYGFLGLITVVIASGTGTLAAWAILTKVMNLPWKFSFLSLGAVAGACLFATLLVGFLGTWQALSQKPAPWLRNQ